MMYLEEEAKRIKSAKEDLFNCPFVCSKFDAHFPSYRLLIQHVKPQLNKQEERLFVKNQKENVWELSNEDINDQNSLTVLTHPLITNLVNKKSQIRKKMEDIDNGRNDACQQCGKCIDKNDDLLAHMSLHAVDKYEDENLRLLNNDPAHQYQHTSTEHDIETQKVMSNVTPCLPKESTKCAKCEKYFSTHPALLCHIREVHENTRPYGCGTCGKTYKRMYQLKFHLQVHSGIVPQQKKYKCNYCGKDFAKVRRHIREVHENAPRPIKCTFCAACFRLPSQLTRHLQKHSESRYQCRICSKSYKQKDGLSFHMRTHTKSMVCSEKS